MIEKSDGSFAYYVCLIERQFDDYLMFATASRAPKKVLDALKDRTHAPIFISKEDEKLPAEQWGKILHSFENRGGYYFSMLGEL